MEFLHRFDHRRASHCASIFLPSFLPFGPFSFPFRAPLRCKFALIIFCFQILGTDRARDREPPCRRRRRHKRACISFTSPPDGFLPECGVRLSGSGWNFPPMCSARPDPPPCSILTGFMTKTGRKAKCIPFHPLTILLLSHFRLISKESSFP